MLTISVVGLGSMSKHIARNLLSAGYVVKVWNRSPEPVEELCAFGARKSSSLEDAFSSDVVITMLANDAAVRGVIIDSGILAAASSGTILVNMATISAELAKEGAQLAQQHGVHYVACPVFGRVALAESGSLNILAAGAGEDIARLQPVLDVIGARTWIIGDQPEQANTVKIIGNYLIACAIQSLGEALSLADAVSVDSETLIDVLTGTLFPGNVYQTYGRIISQRQYKPAGFTARLGLKDVRLALDVARTGGFTLPLGELLRCAYESSISHGRDNEDWSVIADLLPRREREAQNA